MPSPSGLGDNRGKGQVSYPASSGLAVILCPGSIPVEQLQDRLAGAAGRGRRLFASRWHLWPAPPTVSQLWELAHQACRKPARCEATSCSEPFAAGPPGWGRRERGEEEGWASTGAGLCPS